MSEQWLERNGCTRVYQERGLKSRKLFSLACPKDENMNKAIQKSEEDCCWCFSENGYFVENNGRVLSRNKSLAWECHVLRNKKEQHYKAYFCIWLECFHSNIESVMSKKVSSWGF